MAHLRTVVVIPSYNDLAPLKMVTANIEGVADLLIVDDGSTDGTFGWLQSSKYSYVRHESNLGYDSALVTGLSWAHCNYYDFAVTFDADGQHKVSDLVSVIRSLLSGGALVVPYRIRMARFSERIYAGVMLSLLGIRDPMSGLKGYDLRRVSLQDINQISGTVGFGLALMMRVRGSTVDQFPYESSPRFESSPNFGGQVRGNVRILKGLAKAIWTLLKLKGSISANATLRK